MDSSTAAPQSALRADDYQATSPQAQATAPRPIAGGSYPQAEPQKAPGTPARAHEDRRTTGQRASDLRQRRIAHIVDVMGKGLWNTGKTGPQLAREWGVTEPYVRELAGIASHIVRGDVCDREAVQTKLAVTLMTSINEAARRGHHNVVASLVAQYMRLVGLGSPDVAPPPVHGPSHTQVNVQVVTAPGEQPKAVGTSSAFGQMVPKALRGKQAPQEDEQPQDPAGAGPAR